MTVIPKKTKSKNLKNQYDLISFKDHVEEIYGKHWFIGQKKVYEIDDFFNGLL